MFLNVRGLILQEVCVWKQVDVRDDTVMKARRLAVQTDMLSCGFYVISVVRRYGPGSCFIPDTGSATYSPTVR